MVIAVVAVGVMQMTIDQIVDVIAVRDRLVTTIGSMDVPRFVTAALVSRRADGGVHVGNLKRVLFDLAVGADVVQVAVVQVIDMIAMLNSRVLAIGAVLVIVVRMQI